MSARKRIEYVDVAKGIAILCVVAGHTFAAYDPGSLQNKFIYSFHMPLFFILSGFFYKPQEFKKAFWKKVKSLLVPYFVINALRCLVALYQSGFENMLTGYFFPALYGNRFHAENRPQSFRCEDRGHDLVSHGPVHVPGDVSQSGRIFKKIWRAHVDAGIYHRHYRNWIQR